MFSGIPQKNRQAAETYFDEHLSHNDYYSQGEKEHGHWIGLGAEKLGLQQGEVVSREAFLKLCDNQHPQTDEQLTPQHFRQRRIFFDFVCSPPKSVSILAVTMNDRRIVEAHKEASGIAIRELEQFAAARIRKDGIEDRDRTTGNVVGAAFVHTTSRALDPQLHTHFVLFNATWDVKEKRWKALQTGDMFGAINYATEVYRNELAKRLHQMGYETRKARNAFEIEGVDQRLIERFSKRSQQRDMAVKKKEVKLGRKLTKQEVAHVVHQSRPKKLKGASDEQVRQQQLGELGFLERRSLRKVVAAADGQPKGFEQRVWTWSAVDHGVAHVFERNSVVPQHKILEAALMKGCGQLALAELKKELAERSNLVRVGAEVSTREILARELFLIRTVNDGLDAAAPFANRYDAPSHLGADQRIALAHVMTSTDRFTGFRGLAGSGKSTALTELTQNLVRRGYVPFICAPTAAAADTLRKDIPSYLAKTETLQKFLADALKAEGVVSPQEQPINVFDSLSWTEAQKKNVSQYEPGQRIRFIRQTRKFDRGETVEVQAVVESGLRVRRPDGAEVDFIPASAAASFDVGEARELKVAAGDWLLLQANQGRDFINGERVQVREIQNGRIALADGRQLPAGYNTFTHGYAVTSHSSQSKTVDDVLLVASSKSFGAVNREQFYVSISRGRERVHVFTDDAELLARRVTDSRERKAAVELQALRDDLSKLGFVRREPMQEDITPPGTTGRANIARQDFRAVRPMRQTRLSRVSRLPSVQRIAQVVEDVRRWLGEVLSPGQQTDAATQIEPVNSSKQVETVKPTQAVKPAETVKEALQPRQSMRRKLGRGIAPPGGTGHSRGMGI